MPKTFAIVGASLAGATAAATFFEEQRQSPWLDNLTRGHLTTGKLNNLIQSLELKRRQLASSENKSRV